MAKEIKLSKGMKAIVDDSDYDLVKAIRWWVSTGGNTFYAVSKRRENGKVVHFSMHRLIMGVTNPKEVIDHKDWNGLNNQKDNLRVCTQAENLRNKRPSNKWASFFAGVRLTRPLSKQPWSARLLVGGKFRPLGTFRTELEAAEAYHAAVKLNRKISQSKKRKQDNGNNQSTVKEPPGSCGLL